MDNKKLGFLIVLFGVAFIIISIIFKMQVSYLADSLMRTSNGSCFLENGKCIHEQTNLPFIVGISLAAFVIAFGFYVVYLSKAAKTLETINKSLLSEVKSQKNKQFKEEKFKILLTGLDEDEKKVLTAVKEQDGISQSTLKYRVDLSKTKLSMVLSQLEKKGLVAKVKKGKINNIFLKKAL